MANRRLQSIEGGIQHEKKKEKTNSLSILEGGETASATTRDSPIAKRETRVVNAIRLVTVAVVFIVATSVSSLVFWITRRGEVDSFESQFESVAHKLTDDLIKVVTKQRFALGGLALSYTSHALSSNETFPFVTLPDIELRGRNTALVANLISVACAPIVRYEDREAWLDYSKENKGWLSEGLALQEAIRSVESEKDAAAHAHIENLGSALDLDSYSDNLEVAPFFFSVQNGTTVVKDTSSEIVTPLWQMTPALPLSGAINYNLLSQPNHQPNIANVIALNRSFIGPASDFSENNPDTAGEGAYLELALNSWSGDVDFELNYEGGPVSTVYFPIFDKFGSDRKVASVMIAYVYWQSFLTGSLPDAKNTVGIVFVLENTCGQSFSFIIDGSKVSYYGLGDLHDTRYDKHVVEADIDANTNTEVGKMECRYSTKIYPSKELEAVYVTNGPVLMTSIVALVFLLTSLFFVAYDRLVQRRHTAVNKTAVESTAVVDSLFPSAVRERVTEIYGASTNANQEPEFKLASSTLFNINEELSYDGGSCSCPDFDTAPIAEMYSDCTVLLGDISHFTVWCAGRPPSEVFTLLETVYGAFDRLITKFDVFKVETTADCYVAVTGLPSKQDKHGVIMCQFAYACTLKFEQLLPRLADQLGDETFDLAIRFGIHSGPVMAGVLRGEKARFQLYGDTHNIACAMKDSAEDWKIHISHETYRLLIHAGKQAWASPREISNRGIKNEQFQTYWVKPPSGDLKSRHEIEPASFAETARVSAMEQSDNWSIATEEISSMCTNNKTGIDQIHLDIDETVWDSLKNRIWGAPTPLLEDRWGQVKTDAPSQPRDTSTCKPQRRPTESAARANRDQKEEEEPARSGTSTLKPQCRPTESAARANRDQKEQEEACSEEGSVEQDRAADCNPISDNFETRTESKPPALTSDSGAMESASKKMKDDLEGESSNVHITVTTKRVVRDVAATKPPRRPSPGYISTAEVERDSDAAETSCTALKPDQPISSPGRDVATIKSETSRHTSSGNKGKDSDTILPSSAVVDMDIVIAMQPLDRGEGPQCVSTPSRPTPRIIKSESSHLMEERKPYVCVANVGLQKVRDSGSASVDVGLRVGTGPSSAAVDTFCIRSTSAEYSVSGNTVSSADDDATATS